MSGTAFIDLKGNELSLYTFGNGGVDTTTVPVGEGFSFSIEKPSKDFDESYLSLPLELLNFRIIELPFADIKKVRELLPFEIDGLVLGGSEGIVFDAYVLGKSNGKHKILVAYIPKETLRSILGRLAAQGFDPRVITSVELAYIVASSSAEEIPGLLLGPEQMPDEKRIEAASKEMKSPTINLRRGEFAYTADTEKTVKSLKMTAVLAALLALVFLADLALVIFSTRSENQSIRDEIRKTYLGMFPNEKKISSELYQLKAHIKELRERESSLVGTLPLEVLLDLSKTGRPETSFNEITVDRELIVLKGECPSLSDAQKIKNELEGFLKEVSITDTRPSARNRTLFTITARGRKA